MKWRKDDKGHCRTQSCGELVCVLRGPISALRSAKPCLLKNSLFLGFAQLLQGVTGLQNRGGRVLLSAFAAHIVEDAEDIFGRGSPWRGPQTRSESQGACFAHPRPLPRPHHHRNLGNLVPCAQTTGRSAHNTLGGSGSQHWPPRQPVPALRGRRAHRLC